MTSYRHVSSQRGRPFFSLKYEVDHLINKYGLTREEGENVIRQYEGDRDLVNATASEIKASRRQAA